MARENGEKLMNRTGASQHPSETAELVTVTESTPPSSPGDARLIAALRNDYSKQGEVLGHMPRSSDKATRGKGAGLQATLLDMMGERLAFERAGVRLYEALLAKLDAPSPIGPGETAPDRASIERICRQEHEHFMLVKEAIESSGGDPTAVTPAANISATATKGLPAVLLDPRSTFGQCLYAILIAELADGDAWHLLAEVAEANGLQDLSVRFREAQATEEEHLELVREWILQATLAGEPAKALA